MKWALIVMVGSVIGFILVGPPKDKKCRWESPYMNTLQHDIHRRWVCEDEQKPQSR